MAPSRKAGEPRPPALTREMLAEAGLAVLRREGLDALSMRKVAAELDAKAASLYWHVKDKEELLDLLADTLLCDTKQIKVEGDWAERIRKGAQALRLHLRANRDAARVLAGRMAPGPNTLHTLEAMLGWLRPAGFSDADAALATRTIAAYVQGFVLQEQLQLSASAARDTSAEGTDTPLAEALHSAPAEQYPNIAAMADEVLSAGLDEVFSFGLESIIDGLRTRLPREA